MAEYVTQVLNEHEQKRLLTEQGAALYIATTPKTLQKWRYSGTGPIFVRLNRSIRYRLEDLDAFVLAGLRSSTSDPGPASSQKVDSESGIRRRRL
jgi:hypothetical protein